MAAARAFNAEDDFYSFRVFFIREVDPTFAFSTKNFAESPAGNDPRPAMSQLEGATEIDRTRDTFTGALNEKKVRKRELRLLLLLLDKVNTPGTRKRRKKEMKEGEL